MNLFEELEAEVAKCTRCPELVASRSRTVFGDGNPLSRVVFVGEAPGAEEDRQGIPFVGRAGQLLSKELANIGVDRTRYYITNIVKCRPPENRDPKPEEISNCRRFLAAQIALMRPAIIVLVGRHGLYELVKKDMKISEVHGKPVRGRDGIVFYPIYHPAAALRGNDIHEKFVTDIKKFRLLLEREGLL